MFNVSSKRYVKIYHIKYARNMKQISKNEKLLLFLIEKGFKVHIFWEILPSDVHTHTYIYIKPLTYHQTSVVKYAV